MEKSESIKSLAIAMCKAQSEMGGAHKGANNPFFKSKYADLKEVVKAVKEPFAKNGLSYVQFPINDGEKIGVETILMHESGEWLLQRFTVKASKQDAQGAGSVITYCRRYGLQAIAGIPSEDDDGNAASNKKPKEYTANQFSTEKESITTAIRGGMPANGVIKTLEDQGFTISEAIRLEIESI
jgi:hypothetical protein